MAKAKYERNLAELRTNNLNYNKKKVKRKINLLDIRASIEKGNNSISKLASSLQTSRPTIYKVLNENNTRLKSIVESVKNVKLIGSK